MMLIFSGVFAWPFGWSHGVTVTVENFGNTTEDYTTSFEVDFNKSFCPYWEGFLENGSVWIENCEKGIVWIKLNELEDSAVNFTVYFRVNETGGGNPGNVFEFYDNFSDEYEMSCNSPKDGCKLFSKNMWFLNASGTATVNASEGELKLTCCGVSCSFTAPISIKRPFVLEFSGSVASHDNCGSSDYDLVTVVGDRTSKNNWRSNGYSIYGAEQNNNISILIRNLTSSIFLGTKEVGNFQKINEKITTYFWNKKIESHAKGSYNDSLVAYDSTYQNFSRIGFASHDGKQTIDYIRVWKTANATVEVGALESINSTYLVEKAWKTPVFWLINGSRCFDNSWIGQVRIMSFENLSAPNESTVNVSFSNGTVCWDSKEMWSNVSGVNQSCILYNASESWNGSFWFLSKVNTPSKEHAEGWVNETVNWTRFAGYGSESGSQWWVNYNGAGTDFLICIADGGEKYYVAPPPKETSSRGGGGGGGGGGWIVSGQSVTKHDKSENKTQNESVSFSLVNVTGIESVEIAGKIWADNGIIYVEGIGSIEVGEGFVLVDEMGRNHGGGVPVETGRYVLEKAEEGSGRAGNQTPAGTEEGGAVGQPEGTVEARSLVGLKIGLAILVLVAVLGWQVLA